MVKSVDDENRSITFTVLGGDLLTRYKSFDIIMVVTPKDIYNIKGKLEIEMVVEYEKRTKDVHNPDAGLIAVVIKELDTL
ncbi:hypothetical protein MKX01_022618 [Papaver californicum]|nr:hypothetical protein MKX01_022618 [Papaver californicum]